MALQSKERTDVGAFAPIERPRVVARLAASESFPITLVVAPAGYGKSVILRQYLRTLHEPPVRFALRAEHGTLLGFLRGLTEALGERAPYAMTALADAFERSTASRDRGADLALWMHAHLEAFAGVIAIDDLHVAESDAGVAQFLSALVERTKGSIRWILATRSTTGLPVGTWLAYRDADLPIDEQMLRFTSEEARETATQLGLTIGDEELRELLELTEGWPAAMSFALRSSTQSSELRSVSALTREMIYRLLAEQIYASLSEEERALLDVAVALPVIDVAVLERAGFDTALTVLEQLRERTSFIYGEAPGIYQCHDLFREFLRRQTALAGKRSQQTVHAQAAGALEAHGDVEHAIAAYVTAESLSDVVRLLERYGFDLLERARGDVVARAIEALDEQTRRENGYVLGLQGALQATAGKFARAESLFRRALAVAKDDRDLVATVSLRLASILGNQGKDIAKILNPVAKDKEQRGAYRCEALALMAASRAVSDRAHITVSSLRVIESLIPDLSFDARRVRILHHLGVVNRHIGDMEAAYERLSEASALALDLHAFGLASRAYAALSNLALRDQDDVESQLHYAQLAAEAAKKSGDAFALQTALLQILSAFMRNGNVEQSIVVEHELISLRTDAPVRRYVAAFRAARFAWQGRFAEAHGLLAPIWAELSAIDRLFAGAQYALFLSVDKRRDTATRVLREVLGSLGATNAVGLFDRRSIAMSWAMCAVSEAANGRLEKSQRICQRIGMEDAVEHAALTFAKAVTGAIRMRDDSRWAGARQAVTALSALGYRDAAATFSAAAEELKRRTKQRRLAVLTASECDILRRLADGLPLKDIASDTGRTVNTVRAHLAKAMAKLECHGRLEAIRAAKQNGII